MFKIRVLLVSLFVCLWQIICGKDVIDMSSYANLSQIMTKHVKLNLTVDFENKALMGYVELQMHCLETINVIDLDMIGIEVKKVEVQTMLGWKRVEYSIDSPFPILGERLSIYKTKQSGENVNVRIHYITLSDASQRSINWLTADQTAGKQLPYLFTQCESINCRSLAPLQDTPANKITYSAYITVPSQFQVQMSAVQQSVTFSADSLSKTYHFYQKIVIPSYLIALAVGDLQYQKIGKRTGVISEPSVIGAAAECFSALDSYLDKAEEVFGEYVWGNYTILVLPPSFPFGGMENPLMTFASPTVVTKDKQQVFVAIHEIMHSWFGNTITMNNWTDFWLNEGFTVFAERTISGLEFGEEFKKVQAQIGVGDMKADMKVFGYNHSYSSLQPNIQHDNPDNMFSTVPYEKGYFFLTYLATQIGHDNFIQFLREYIIQFRFTSISTANFVNYFKQHCNEHSYDISQVDWHEWLDVPGLPPIMPNLTTTIYKEAMQLADDYLANEPSIDYSQWFNNTHYFSSVKVLFINHFLSHQVDTQLLTRLDNDLQISQMDDPEVKNAWYQLSIKANYLTTTLPLINTFLSVQGRLKYLSPIYRALMNTQQSSLIQFARDTFQQNIQFYHPLALTQIHSILYPQQSHSLRIQQ